MMEVDGTRQGCPRKNCWDCVKNMKNLGSESKQAVGGRPPRYAPVPSAPPWALCKLLLGATQEGGWAGQASRGHWFSRSRPTMPYTGRWSHAQLTVLRLSVKKLYSRRTVWQGQSSQYWKKPSINTAQSPSITPLPLHYSTLTRLMNLAHQAAHSTTHHQVYSHRFIGVAHCASKPWRGLSAGEPKRQPPRKTECNCFCNILLIH